MAEISFDARLTNIESNYSNMAQSQHRIAGIMEAIGKKVDNIHESMLGRIDPETGKYIPGSIARLDNIEKRQNKCLSKQANWWRKLGYVICEIAIIVVAAWVISGRIK